MVKNHISRKKFIVSTLTGIAGIGLINRSFDIANTGFPGLRNIGNTGISVTPVCFGAPRTNEESLIKYALDKGITFIDTGRSYGNGNNERLVGRSIKGISKNI